MIRPSSEHTQDGRDIKHRAESARVFLFSLVARSRDLCAELEQDGHAAAPRVAEVLIRFGSAALMSAGGE
jgi:hypothetical protein